MLIFGYRTNVRRCVVIALASVAVFSGFGSPIPSWAADDEHSTPRKFSLADVQIAWKHRQERLAAATGRWSEARTYYPGAYSSPDSPKSCPDRQASGLVDVVFSFDREAYRINLRGLQYSGKLNALREMQIVFNHLDGSEDAFFGVRDVPGKYAELDYPVGFEKKSTTSTYAREPSLWPAMLYLRPLSPDLQGLDFNKLVLGARPAVIDGADCIILRYRDPSFNIENDYWVEPSRDFVVRRTESQIAGNICFVVDVSYRADPSVGPAPAAWTLKKFSLENGNPEYEFSVANAVWEFHSHVDKSDIAFPFPPGTVVTDLTTSP